MTDKRPGEGIMPPCDLDAEGSVLSECVARGSTADVRSLVSQRDFYADANARIYGAMLALECEGKPLDLLGIVGHLRATDQLQRVGGSPYVAQLLTSTPSCADIAVHAQTVADMARRRRLLDVAREIEIRGRDLSDSDVDALSARATQLLASVVGEPSKKRDPFGRVGTETVFEKLQPIPWVVRDLCIGPGRPTLVAGFGFSGKTMAMQALAVAVASGTQVWGHFHCRQGSVLHLDYEQGKHATYRRYQRLAFGMGLHASDLAGNLDVACFPSAYLTDAAVETHLEQACQGTMLCIIDSFRAAIPGLDENDSSCRQALDLLTRVSERTGCAFVVIHHAAKAKEGGRDKRESPRGSSAIFDACGTILRLSCEGPFQPTSVELVKTSASAEGRQGETFVLETADIADEEAHDCKAGLLVSYMSEEQANPPTSADDRIRKAQEAVLKALTRQDSLTQNELVLRASIRKADISGVLDSLLRAGKITVAPGPNRAKVYTQVVPGGSGDSDDSGTT